MIQDGVRFGCNCYYADSDFKRYNRAIGGDTVIFNYNSNNSYSCCNGKTCGFWGSFGLGLGAGLGNWVGGFMGGLSNMFSGFGLGGFGLGGFGLGGYGLGGYGLGGGFGLGGYGLGSTLGNSWNSSLSTWLLGNRPSTPDSTTLNDKDYASINEMDADADKLIADIKAGTVSTDDAPKKINDMIKALQDYKGNKKDAVNSYDNNKHIDNIIARLKAVKPSMTPVVTTNVVAPGTVSVEAPAVAAPTVTAAAVGENEILVDGTPTKFDAITFDDLANIEDDDINALTTDQAIKLLDELGYTEEDSDGNKIGKMSGNYKVLLLLQASELNVEVARNPLAPDDDGMIRGRIEDVELVNGQISYSVDNSTWSGDYGLKYFFTGNSAEGFELTEIYNPSYNPSTTTRKINGDWKTRVYKFNGEGNPLTISGHSPLVSVNGSITLEKGFYIRRNND